MDERNNKRNREFTMTIASLNEMFEKNLEQYKELKCEFIGGTKAF